MAGWIDRALAPMAVMLVITACGNDGTGPDGQLKDVQVSFATTRAQQPAAASARVFFDDTLTSGVDTIFVSSVGIVLREVELKRLGADDCDKDVDACEKFESGPILVMLPLNGEPEVQFALDIPDGVYSEIEFDIHKVGDSNPEDLAFAQQHPEYRGKSIRVQGMFNGTNFLYETDLNVEQELQLNPPLVVDSTRAAAAITVFVDIDRWFRDNGGALVDPATGNKGGANEGLVKENIKQSFEAFEEDGSGGKG